MITGITGQDGAYLANWLVMQDYEVFGLMRRSSSNNLKRLEYMLNDITLLYGDITDAFSITKALRESEPDEVYNLAAQSHVHVSFFNPQYTGQVDALGTTNLLECIMQEDHSNMKLYQASTSELFGNSPAPQNELTPFDPRSPYAIAKQYSFNMIKNYRESYKLHASNGILFNHESPFRGSEFVTRKITTGLANMATGNINTLHFGNIDSKRDWGHAKDYTQGMWKILQQDVPDDYVLATGESHTVREFIEESLEYYNVSIEWDGEGIDEIGYIKEFTRSRTIPSIKIDPRLYRPNEVHHLCGDYSKAKRVLDWEPNVDFKSLVREMTEYDFLSISRQ